MSILRQGTSFLFVGGCLVLVDWGVFVLLSASGVNTPVANVAGRVVGALLGFVANGHITFGSAGQGRLGMRRFVRFAMLWLVMTVMSTYLVSEVATHLSLQTAWLGKPMVEAVLAVASFIVSRHWVYR
jgi:Predicted membrane protein